MPIEAWKDLKFGIRIHWGLYAMMGSDASWAVPGSSPEFRDLYDTRYQFFDPVGYDPEGWVRMFQRSGIRFFTITTKHHDGFSLWPTETMQESIRLGPKGIFHGKADYETAMIHYSIVDAPYRKDLLSPLVEAARRGGIAPGFYYSHIDWHDPAFAWDPNNRHYDPKFTAQSDPARWQRFIGQEREQLRELLTNYGPIVNLDLDMGWPKEASPDLIGIVKMLRKLQPDCLFRNRGIGAYGDHYTPEREIPAGFETKPFKVIYPDGNAFSYLPNDNYKPKEWILSSLIDAVSKGGNFEVGFGPTAEGTWPPETVERLAWVGDWLRVNGEAIYATRTYRVFNEGKDIRFTRSKDGATVYAISLKWPGRELHLKSVPVASGSKITMIGVAQPIAWHSSNGEVVIDVPASVEAHKPCEFAYVFKICSSGTRSKQ